MKSLLKKFALGMCITTMLFGSTTVFAENTEIKTNTLVLEEITGDTVINPNETIVVPFSAITDRPTILNGQTGYFNNGETNNPFYFLSGTYIKLSASFGSRSYFKMGLVNSNTYQEVPLSSSTNIFRDTTSVSNVLFRTTSNGNYKVYLTNYGASPISIRTLDITHW